MGSSYLPFQRARAGDHGVKSQQHVSTSARRSQGTFLGPVSTEVLGLLRPFSLLWCQGTLLCEVAAEEERLGPGPCGVAVVVAWNCHVRPNVRVPGGRGGFSLLQAAASDQRAGRGGDGGVVPGHAGVHGGGHHGQGRSRGVRAIPLGWGKAPLGVWKAGGTWEAL